MWRAPNNARKWHMGFNSAFKGLKTNINLNYIQRFSPYRAVNTLDIGYKNESVNVVKEIIAVYSQIHTKHINTLCGHNVEFLVHIVNTGL